MTEATKSAIGLLIAERDRLNQAIEILQGEVSAPKRRGRPPGSKNKKKPAKSGRRSNMSPAARKAVSERMKKYWAQRRKEKK